MFEDENVIKLCIREHISVEQYFFMWLVRRQDFNQPDNKSLAKQYVKLVRAFSTKDIDSLVDKGFIEDFNSPNQSNPDLYILKDKASVLFTDEDSGEELFRRYPTTFPLKDKGSSFLARTGAPKEVIIDKYLKAIGYSREKHKFAMKQLANYVMLVNAGKINGKKLIDFVDERIWESVADYMEQSTRPGDEI